MNSPTYLTLCCLLPRKDLWNLQRACLTSRALALCDRCSSACLSASRQVSWDIQDARDFVGHGVLMPPPLSFEKAAYISVWDRDYFSWISQRVRPCP